MKLSKATIRPGMVLEVFDDGSIKASAPGLFSIIDNPENMPPILPWFVGSNCNAYSKPNKCDEVWIMNFSDNPRQLYWFRKDRVDNNENIPMHEQNVEVLCNRECKGEWITLYFSDGSGWIISKGESCIKIKPNGSIILDNGMPNRCIDINNKNISIGSEGTSDHPAAYGDEIEKLLRSLCILLFNVGIKGMSNPYTIPLSVELFSKLPAIIKKIPNVSSQHVTID